MRLKFKQYLIIAAASLGALAVSFGSTVFVLKQFVIKQDPIVKTKTSRLPPPVLKTDAQGDKIYNLLLLGYGGAGHDGGALTDVIKLVHVNFDKKKIAVISIPRDLWVPIQTRSDMREHYKINHAYAIGMDDKTYPLKQPQHKGQNGAYNLTKEVVGEVTGMEIDNVVAVDFQGFKETVDVLGGIIVNVPKTFDDHFYPVKGLENETCGFSPEEIAEFHEKYSGFELEKQFTCRYEHLHFDQGLVEMDGESALKFVRSRHSDQHGGDFARAERQWVVLNGIKDKALSLKALDDVSEFINIYGKSVHHDLNVEEIAALIYEYPEIRDYQTKMISLSTDNILQDGASADDQYVLIPKSGMDIFSGIHQFIQESL